MKRLQLNLIWIAIMVQWCHATDSDSLYTQYTHGLNTDSWQAILNFQTRLTDRSKTEIHENATSSRLKFGSKLSKWKDQHDLKVRSGYITQHDLTLEFLGTHYFFSDKQSGYENDIQSQFVAFGASLYKPNLFLPVMAGVKQDRRLNLTDTGISFSTGLNMPALEFSDYRHKLYSSFSHDYLQKRKNRTHSIQYQINRSFYEDTADTLNYQYQGLRRDYYITPEGTIENREETSQMISNKLNYRISDDSRIHLTGGISMHRLNISLLNGVYKGPKRERKDFSVYGALKIYFEKPWVRSVFRTEQFSEDQRYQLAEFSPSSPYSGSSLLITPDNQSRVSIYSLKTDFPFSTSDTLSFDLHAQKMAYDTPDEGNFDDRDELRWHADLTWKNRISRTVQLEAQISSHLTHLVYLYGEKSADNNWTRILQLSPMITWQPNESFSWKQSTSVLANYVDYDFDTELAGIRSFLYRKFQMDDSVMVALSPKTQIYLQYRLESDENGKLVWDEWVEQKLIDRISQTLSVFFNFMPDPRHQIRPGYTGFIRKGYRYETSPDGTQIRKNQLDFRSHGPLLRWSYDGRRLLLSLSAQTIRTQTLQVRRQIYTRLDFRMRWRF